jgi:hypothetical protein
VTRPLADDALDRARPLEDRVVRWLARQPGRVSFGALRRALAAHPESLTRVLRRLERGGVLGREDGGYALSDGYHHSLGRPPERPFHAVASVELARGVDAERVLGSLAGRWFGGLRWVGVYERDEDPWLVWSTEDPPGHVLLSVHGRTLRVGVEEGSSDQVERLADRARELLVHGLERLPPSEPSVGSVRGFAATPGTQGWAS